MPRILLWLSIAVAVTGCNDAPSPVPRPPLVVTPAVAVFVDAAVPDAAGTPDAAPPNVPCVPSEGGPEWDPDVTVAADGDRAIVCYTSTNCMLVEPRTGAVVADATPKPPDASARTEDAPPTPFELSVDPPSRTLVFCSPKTCTRVPGILPVGKLDTTGIAVDANGTLAFVIDDDHGDTFSVATQRRIGRVNLAFPENQPPPPGNDTDVVFWGRGILLGDFAEVGTMERLIDPLGGDYRWLGKPWTRLPGDLVLHYEWDGRVDLFDLDANNKIVATRKVTKLRPSGQGTSGYLVRVGANALVVTATPAATTFVDSRARTISKPRPLPLCPR